jgi:hypothetical protein
MRGGSAPLRTLPVWIIVVFAGVCLGVSLSGISKTRFAHRLGAGAKSALCRAGPELRGARGQHGGDPPLAAAGAYTVVASICRGVRPS